MEVDGRSCCSSRQQLPGPRAPSRGGRGVGARGARLRLRGRRLAAHQRQPRPARGARGRARGVGGRRERARVRHRLHGERRRDPGARRARRGGRLRRALPRSIIDGCKLSAAPRCASCRTAMSPRSTRRSAARGESGRVLVALDGVYSMDGDVAPLPELLPRRAATARSCCSTTRTAWARSAPAAAAARSCSAWKGRPTCCSARSARRSARSARSSPGAALRDLLVTEARSFIFSRRSRPPQIEASRAALRVLGASLAARAAALERARACARPRRPRPLDGAEHDAHRAGRDRRERRDDGRVRGAARARLLRAGHPATVRARRHRAPAPDADGDARGRGAARGGAQVGAAARELGLTGAPAAGSVA